MKKIELCLYGDRCLNVVVNQAILKASISFLKSTGRFDVPLLAKYFTIMKKYLYATPLF